MSGTASRGIAPNATRLLYAGFMAILAAGVGFSVRGGVLGQWADQFGFTMSELGGITGGGLAGFGAVIILTSLFADRIGYGKIMVAAFVLHFISAVMTLGTDFAFEAGGKSAAYWNLFFAMILFSVANGLCEAVVNPLTATLFPKDKTHYLNILHAGWPAGLVLGALAAFFMAGSTAADGTAIKPVAWQIQMSLFLIPVVIYGLMLIGQKFPPSEASAAGVSTADMLKTLAAPLMLFLILIHAMVGYVELGTDSWISKITGTLMADPSYGLALFVYTSSLMFVLRYVAGPIVHRISPLGLLFVSAIMGFIGLTMLGNTDAVAKAVGGNVIVACVIAATIYGFGKTFLWPTMLAVASERFPNGGAISIGVLGGAGMLSAGLIGGPAIGFKQDYFATQYLTQNSEASYSRYKAAGENKLFGTFKVVGLDGQKVATLEDEGKELARVEALYADPETKNVSVNARENQASLSQWWSESKSHIEVDKPAVNNAVMFGSAAALRMTALIPAVMALCYLLLIIGFKLAGGYKPVELKQSPESLGTGES